VEGERDHHCAIPAPRDSLIRDKNVFGVKERALRKKLLQERQLALEKAIDICKSGETTAQHLKAI